MKSIAAGGAAAALALLLAVAPVPAQAKAGDSAWAQCVWSQAPLSAAKWLAMPLPTWESTFSDSNLLLGHMLIATCDESAANPKKPNRSPAWKALAAALKASRPAALPSAHPARAVDVLLCQSALTGDEAPYVYLAEVVRRAGGRETTSFQQYFVRHDGRQVMLPQDIRTIPAADAHIDRTCRAIGPEGELGDAQ